MTSHQRLSSRTATIVAAALVGLFSSAANAALLQNGLVGYWPLNEGTGATVNDVAPSDAVADNGVFQTGTGLNPPTWINGMFNAGLQFTGTEGVLIPNSTDMDINTNAVTLSAWVKLAKLPGDASLPSFAGIFDSQPDNYVLYLDKGNSELRFKATDNAGVSTGAHPGIPASMLNTTDWFHVMGVYDGSQGSSKIYLNGNLVDTSSLPTNVQLVKTGQVAGLGHQPNSTSPYAPTASTFFQGGIADVAVWNRPLGGAEAQYLYNAGTGNAVGATNPDIAPLPPLMATAPTAKPVIYWRLDGDLKNSGTGGAALDAVLNDGPDASGAHFAASKVGQGLDLRANPTATNSTATNGDYLAVNYTLPDKGTISMNFQDMTWFDFNSLWSNSAHGNAWEAWIYGAGRLSSRANENTSNANLDYYLPLQGANAAAAPHNVVFTWEKNGTLSSNKLYVDGILRDQFVETWRAPGTTFFVGGGLGVTGGANHLGKGIYDEVRVYDVVLNDSEVLALSQVPEPASVALVCMGLIAAAFCGRGQHRQATA